MFAIGERFDRYRIDALLGQGGMGAVYCAFDSKLERRVALKILRSSAEQHEHDSAGHAARLLREARAAAALDHPNVISIFDVGEVDGTTYLTMEFIEGTSLRSKIGADIPLNTRIGWLIDIAKALSSAHRRGLVHRDIKPENVMLRNDGVIKVLDFGIARRTRALTDATGSPTNQSTTLDGPKIVGTPHYMAPEQMRGGQVDGRTDQFAWGVLAYELLSGGAFPWPGATDFVALIAAVMSEEPRPLPSITGLAPTVADTVMRTLRRSPNDRFAAMDDVIVALGEEAPMSLKRGLQQASSPDNRGAGQADAAFAENMGADDGVARVVPKDKPLSTTGAMAETISAEQTKPHTPAKLGTSGRRKIIIAGVLAVLGITAGVFVVRPRLLGNTQEGTPTAPPENPSGRRSIAVLGFKSLSGRDDVAWIGTALVETMTNELAASDQIRAVSVEDVERMKRDLKLGDEDKLGKDALTRVGKNLGTELVVAGTYLAVGGKIRLDARLLDVKSGDVLASVNESDSETAFIDLVARAGSALRRHLRAGELTKEREKDLRALQPTTPEAAKTYAEGLAKLRSFRGQEAKTAFERVVEIEPNFAPGHAALADAYIMLGMAERATEEAKRAVDLSASLGREERMVNEFRHHEATNAWDKAIEVGQTLHETHPDNLEYGLRLAKAQTEGAKAKDALETLKRLHRLPPPLGDDPRIDLAEAEAQTLLGDATATLEASRRAQDKAELTGAVTIAVRAQMMRGSQLVESGDAAQGVKLLDAAKEQATKLGDTLLRIEILNNIAIANSYRGDLDQAIQQFSEAQQAAKQLGNGTASAQLLSNLTTIQINVGRLDQAEQSLAQNKEEVLNPLFQVQTRVMTARIFALRGEAAKARAEYAAVIQRVRESNSDRDAAWAQALFAELALDEGNYDEAETLARESLVSRTRQQNALFSAESRLVLARIKLAKRQHHLAETEAKAALETFIGEKAAPNIAEARAVLARIQLATNCLDDAMTSFAGAKTIASSSRALMARFEVTITAAQMDARQGKADDARKSLDALIEEVHKLGITRLELIARIARARVDIEANNKAEGMAALVAIAKEAEKLKLEGIAKEARP